LSGFDVTTRASLLKGGTHGPAVTPGSPSTSRLFEWVSSGKMPQGGPRLDQSELKTIEAWIAAGAPWDNTARLSTPARREVWAFRTPVKPEPPRGPGAPHPPLHPIDAFLLAKLQQKGLGFAPEADHRTLIRRLHFDLTGLPPSPEAIGKDYQSTVENLLGAPEYGERWGRYWLDVVRFGESDGGEHNFERLHAWPYRDYVIESFNNDKPYQQFIREQIAGDLLHPGDPKMTAATGFLVAGPWDSVSAELNKDKNMALTARMDELDDMVTTTFHTFQALTVNCARCHDHKFDPIPTRDYYSLTSVFGGVGFGTRKVATAAEQAEWDGLTKPHRDKLDRVRRQLAAIEDPVRTRLLTDRYKAYATGPRIDRRPLTVNAFWNHNTFAPVTAPYYRFVVTNQNGRKPRIDRLELQPAGIVAGPWEGAAKATDDEPQIMPIPGGGAVSSIEWSSDRLNGSREGWVKVYRLEASDDGKTWRSVASSLDHVGPNELDLPELKDADVVAALSPEQRAERIQLIAQRTEADAQVKAFPEPRRIYAALPRDMHKSFVLERGSVARPKEPVNPGALTAVKQLSAAFGLPAESKDSERRLALANWIADPLNPLTARVIVNRVWYYHFGAGIVNTPSDFGVNGDRPSHPELLDWLAVSFMENGWSLKWLHRQILSTRAYRQSSAMNAKAFAADAGNRLLWRMPLKRMDAEMLRDSVLQASGNLNPARGGPSFMLQKKGDRGSYIYAALDNDGPDVWRRAVYRFVVRGGERIMMDSFDCPDPSVATPQRSVSNTPIQALTMMNNPFVLRQAGLLSRRLERDHPASAESRVGAAYRVLFQREPSAQELSLAKGFLASNDLTAYLRVLLNSNEFMYVP